MLQIVPYNPQWPQEFERLATALRATLGELALRVDHIGSTAVEGLSAKDVIDIQITVRAMSPAVLAAVLRSGFVQHGEDVVDHAPPGLDASRANWAKLLFVEPVGWRRAKVHVREVGKPNQRYALLFRDYLRANPRTAAAYAELKRRLAVSLSEAAAYSTVKDPAVDLIYFAAEEWAASTGWEVPR